MYAIIQSGGKQYRVAEGETLKLEKLAGEAGESIDFNDVLLVSDGDQVQAGTPLVKGAQVTGEVVDQGRAKKVEILKFRRRKHHMKRQGHRQSYTAVKITKIKAAAKKQAAQNEE